MSTVCLLIVGMHRSGTSALTGAISHLGAYAGPMLVPGIQGVNAKGFWEHPGIVDVHECLLGHLNSSWHDVRPLPASWWQSKEIRPFKEEIKEILERDFFGHPLWVIKDPRMCRLLPMWKELLGELGIEARYLITLRHPLAVAASLSERDSLPVEHACLLWAAHMMESERETRDGRRTFVSFDRLLSDWRPEMSRIAIELGVKLGVAEPEASKTVGLFLDPHLKHHAPSVIDNRHPSVAFAGKVFASMEGLSGKTDSAAMVDSYYSEHAELVKLIAPWSDEINELRRVLHETQVEAATHEQRSLNFQHEVFRLKHTFSWRITSPLRLIYNLFWGRTENSAGSQGG